MKTKSEIIEAITKGVNDDLDITIYVYRKSDNYKTSVANILGNTDTVESYIDEMEEEIHSLVEFKNWEIAGYDFEIE
ncbi:MAG: hypothetical protein ACLFQA_00195 [Bacteroidales bacterium]